MLAKKRTTHSKSRKGCLQCKRRHRRCDECWPTCSACDQRREQCTWPNGSPDSIQIRGFRTYTPRHVAPAVENDEALNIEHFCARTLGFLQEARPSAFWRHSLSFLLHTSPAFQKIVAAFGSQQRLLSDGDPSNPFFATQQHDADIYYSQALRSLRQSIAARTANDRTPLIFGSILMMLLESLRNAPNELLVHLGCGVQIVSEAPIHSKSTDEYMDALALLHSFYTSCMIYCAAPGRVAHMPRFLAEHKFRMIPPAALDTVAALTLEMNILSVRTINATSSMFGPGDPAMKRARLIAAFGEIGQKHSRLRQALTKWKNPQADDYSEPDDHPSLNTARAGVLLSGITVDSIVSGDPVDAERKRRCFAQVLDLLERALVRLNKMGHGRQSFSVVMGPLSMLDIIVSTCGDDTIRERVLHLLDLCPPREGLWQVSQMKTTLTRKLMSKRQPKDTLRSDEASHLGINSVADGSAENPLPSTAVELFNSFQEWDR